MLKLKYFVLLKFYNQIQFSSITMIIDLMIVVLYMYMIVILCTCNMNMMKLLYYSNYIRL